MQAARASLYTDSRPVRESVHLKDKKDDWEQAQDHLSPPVSSHRSTDLCSGSRSGRYVVSCECPVYLTQFQPLKGKEDQISLGYCTPTSPRASRIQIPSTDFGGCGNTCQVNGNFLGSYHERKIHSQ